MSSERLSVRSYRRVFHVDRRIYRVDRWPVPVPGGVPLRAVVYFVAALLAVLLLGALPVTSAVLGVLDPPLRYVVLPLAVAALGTQVAPDGRLAHRFARDWLAHRLRRRRRSAGRPVALEGEPVPWHSDLSLRADEHRAALRPARVRGPVRVLFRDPLAVTSGRRGRRVARPLSARGEHGAVLDSIELAAGETLEVRS